MTLEELWKPAVGIIIPVGAFLFWHFKTLNDLHREIHKLEIQMKDLEKNDALQQQTLDQLKELYPVIQKVLENLPKNNQ